MNLLRLGSKSLANRKSTVLLTVATIAISVALILGVERVRQNAWTSFSSTVSGADLIVGARSGAVQLLLYSVFRIGNATNNISYRSFEEIADRKEVKWAIPISLGDSHGGYRVMGTSTAYFDHYRFGNQRSLEFSAGDRFSDLFDVVLGAEVAETLGYELGDQIVIAHGAGTTSFITHDDKPFVVKGILERTGTPVDRTLHVSLEAIEAIHIDWKDGAKIPGQEVSAEMVRKLPLNPKSITAMIVGLESRIAVFGTQRWINNYTGEPLLAILPGVALQELWSLVRVAEKALLMVSLFVIAAAFVGMVAVSLAGLNERRREIAVLRATGAGFRHVFGLLFMETILLTLAGIILGMLLVYMVQFLGQETLELRFGLYMPLTLPTAVEWQLLLGVFVAGVLAGLVPAYRAYRNSLADGLTARL